MTSRTVALGEVCTFRSSLVDPTCSENSTLPHIAPDNIERDTGRLLSYRTVAEDGVTSGKYRFEAGDLLYSKIRPNLNKLTAVDFSGLCSADMYALRVDERQVTRGFLAHVLRSQLFLDFATSLSNRANIPKLNRTQLMAFRFELPPLDEQRRIVAILDSADRLRAQRQEAIAQLDELPLSIFLEMFGDPATNERGWALKPFGEVCETRLGKMLDAKQQTGKDARPYLRNANVQWFRLDLNDLMSMDFDERSRSILRLMPGDLLVCEGGEPGRAAVWRGDLDECYFQKALHRARPDPALAQSDFLAYVFWFLVKRGGLKDHVTSATIAHLTGMKLRAMPVILPDVSLQQTFVERLFDVMRLRETMERFVGADEELFASLRSRAFSGRL